MSEFGDPEWAQAVVGQSWKLLKSRGHRYNCYETGRADARKYQINWMEFSPRLSISMQQPRIGLFFDFTAVQWQQPLSDLQQGLVVSGRPYLISSVPPACSALQDSCSITLQPRLPPGFQLQLLTELHSMFHFCCRLGPAL